MDQSPMSNLEQGYRTAYLIAQHLKNALTEAERAELDHWLLQSEDNRRLFKQLTDPRYLEAEAKKQEDIDTESYLGKFKADIKDKEERKIRRIWLGAAVAAAVFSVLLITVIRPFKNEVSPEEVLASVKLTQPAPEWKGWRKATLTIAEKTFQLGENAHDTIIGNGLIVKSGSTLVYASNVTSGQHKISVPDKGTYTVQLPDGTVATLNSYATLTYDVPFDKKERRVELNGEGYFQVAKDANRPFRVMANADTAKPMTIEAIGTSFNVIARRSNWQSSAILVEGKVKVSIEEEPPIILQPNEMAFLGAKGVDKKTVDAEAAIAWTQHQFIFNGTPLIDALGQLTLWYGTKFNKDHVPNEQMHGTFSRDESVEDILRKLSSTGAFRFKTEGTRITIY